MGVLSVLQQRPEPRRRHKPLGRGRNKSKVLPAARDSFRSLASALKASGSAGKRDHPVAALLLVTVSMALLVGIAAVGRGAALSGIDPTQALFFRNFFCVVWMLPLFAWRGLSLVKTSHFRLYGIRVMVNFIALSAFFQALALLPISEVTAINFLAPLLGTLFAILLLGEHVGTRRWAAIAVGLLGALVIFRPTESAFGIGQIAALTSAVAIGVIGVLVKQLTLTDDPDRVVFITNLLLTPPSLIPALFVWTWPPLEMWPLLVLMGLFAVLGRMALVRGFALSDATLVMIFKFSRLPFAVLVGYLAFGDLMNGWTWVGAIIIFAAALYVRKQGGPKESGLL